jgi:hypothetical protein
MPLDHYGVLLGTLTQHFRDTPDNQGNWYHVNLRVDADGSLYRCAIDVDSHASAVGVQWKVLRLPMSALGPVAGLADGHHELGMAQSDGALDLIRHPSFVDDPDCVPRRPWISGSNLEASVALESILHAGRRTLVWGEPFDTGLGMHNIHQNQGDPLNSQWADENGIWQDGGTMTVRPDGDLDVFVSKFTSQSSQTDDEGHPA